MNLKTSSAHNKIPENARAALISLQEDIQEGLIKTQTELLLRLEGDLDTLTRDKITLSVPEYREGNIPLKSLLTVPFLQAQADIENQWDLSESLRLRLSENYNYQAGVLTGLEDKIKAVSGLVQQAALMSSQTQTFYWATSNFKTLGKTNVSETNARVETRFAYVSLPVASESNQSSHITAFTIDKTTSVGVPGNNLEIKNPGPAGSPQNNPEPTPELFAATSLDSSIGALFDGQPNTVFEWESLYVPRKQKLKKLRSAYVYDSTGTETDVSKVTGGWGWNKYVLWPGEQNWDYGSSGRGYALANFDQAAPAALAFTLTLDAPVALSAIEVEAQSAQGLSPNLKSLSISQDGQTYRTIFQNLALTDNIGTVLGPKSLGFAADASFPGALLPLPTTLPIKYIKFIFEQPASYIPPDGFGHVYFVNFTQVTQKSSGFFGIGASSSAWTEQERMEGAQQGVSAQPAASLNLSGLLSNVGTVAGAIFGGPLGATIGSAAGSLLGTLVDGFFSSHKTTTPLSSEIHYDIFTGTRSVIALKDITLLATRYGLAGTYSSSQHLFQGALQSVLLITSQTIPEGWPEGTWITYEVSSDNRVWVPITPGVSLPVSGAAILYLRAHFSRPDNLPGESPLLHGYALKGLPQ